MCLQYMKRMDQHPIYRLETWRRSLRMDAPAFLKELLRSIPIFGDTAVLPMIYATGVEEPPKREKLPIKSSLRASVKPAIP
jgi:hypothetical protein